MTPVVECGVNVMHSVISQEQETGHVLILLSTVKQMSNVQDHVRVIKIYSNLYSPRIRKPVQIAALLKKILI